MRAQRGLLVGVAGGSGSGKTRVVETLKKMLDDLRVAIVQQDTYYRDLSHLTFEERSRQNFDHPNAFDEELLIEHLEKLLDGRTIQQPIYDFANHRRSNQTNAIEWREIIILEGILALHSEKLRRMMALKIFVETDADIRLVRRLRRDLKERGRSIDSVLDQYEATVRPMHLQFVEPTRAYADLIITYGGENLDAIAEAKVRIESLLPAG